MDANFSKSVQDNGKQKRWFSKSLSFRIDSLNGAKILRSWLCYSPMTGRAFCFTCKLFTSHNDNVFAGVGYVHRKNAVARIEKHENMQSESSCCVSCIVQQSWCKKPSGQSTWTAVQSGSCLCKCSSGKSYCCNHILGWTWVTLSRTWWTLGICSQWELPGNTRVVGQVYSLYRSSYWETQGTR